jgi:hypothetical protein
MTWYLVDRRVPFKEWYLVKHTIRLHALVLSWSQDAFHGVILS